MVDLTGLEIISEVINDNFHNFKNNFFFDDCIELTYKYCLEYNPQKGWLISCKTQIVFASNFNYNNINIANYYCDNLNFNRSFTYTDYRTIKEGVIKPHEYFYDVNIRLLRNNTIVIDINKNLIVPTINYYYYLHSTDYTA